MGQPKWLIGVAFLFLCAALICLSLEGNWLGGSEVSSLDRAMSAGFSYTGVIEGAKLFWQCLTWNFPYLLEGVGVYIRLFVLMPISLALVFEFGALIARLVIPWAS